MEGWSAESLRERLHSSRPCRKFQLILIQRLPSAGERLWEWKCPARNLFGYWTLACQPASVHAMQCIDTRTP